MVRARARVLEIQLKNYTNGPVHARTLTCSHAHMLARARTHTLTHIHSHITHTNRYGMLSFIMGSTLALSLNFLVARIGEVNKGPTRTPPRSCGWVCVYVCGLNAGPVRTYTRGRTRGRIC